MGDAGVATWEKPIGPIGAIEDLGIFLRDACGRENVRKVESKGWEEASCAWGEGQNLL